MKIFIDADACPKVITEHLFKTAARLGLELVLVADKFMRIPSAENIRFIKVPPGTDSADLKIVELAEKNDVVITSDIPLADLVIKKEAYAVSPRGEVYTGANIKERLAVRDMMAEFRDNGMETGGPPAFSPKDRINFINRFDKLITQLMRNRRPKL